MINCKKTSLVFALLMLTQITNCITKRESEQQYEAIMQSLTTDYEYKISIQEKSAHPNSMPTPSEIISDIIESHNFDTGFTRIKTTSEVKDGKTITKIQTWVTKNSSLLTTLNLMLAIAALSVLGYKRNIGLDLAIIGIKIPIIEGLLYEFLIKRNCFERKNQFKDKTDKLEIQRDNILIDKTSALID